MPVLRLSVQEHFTSRPLRVSVKSMQGIFNTDSQGELSLDLPIGKHELTISGRDLETTTFIVNVQDNSFARLKVKEIFKPLE